MAAKERAGNQCMVVPVAAGVELIEGQLAVLNTNGFTQPASKEAGLLSIGVVTKGVDNRLGANGENWAEVKRGAWKLKNDGTIKLTDTLKPAYIKDADTVTITDTGSSIAGKVLQIETDGVVIEIL